MINNQEIVLHGTFVSIFGVGTHFMGRPGIGKSELALSLIDRQHQLIADDTPLYTQQGQDIIGRNPLERPYLCIRGVGIIDIMAIAGTSAFKASHRLDLIINLQDHTGEFNEFSQLEGLHDTKELFGCLIPTVTIPIIHCRPLEVLVETIVKNYLIQTNKGYNPVLDFEAQLQRKIGQSHS